ncbi:MAG: PSD1 and planctomycete cytochrome C domain-containing protein [Verrucomicrobiota bacterium]
MNAREYHHWAGAMKLGKLGCCSLVLLAQAAGGLNAAETDGGKIEDAAGLEFFENKIRPVLVDKCYRCHSVDAKKLKAGLMLDHRSRILKGGDSGASVQPGNPDESLLIETIIYDNADLQMPPKSKLDDSVVADFKKWVAMGAPWPEVEAPMRSADSAVIEVEGFDIEKRRASHWSWQPITSPDLPVVKNASWSNEAIDRFILAGLEKESLLPAEAAEPSTWLRRVYFDLIGLPPTPAEIGAFLRAGKKHPNSSIAEQAVVDHLLASQHFGERWARHWMDMVRFAETAGHEFDKPIPDAWRYRDYLIRAFNEDLPYDQFLTEHLAGDLLDKPRRHPETQTNESILATGFWFLNETVHAPTDVLADESDRVDNQIDVFGKTFLGLTIGCARCHDHKFDAISTADYYALCGMMQSSRRQGAFLDPYGKIAEAAEAARQLYRKGDQRVTKVYDRQKNSKEDSVQLLAEYLLAGQEVIDRSQKGHIVLSDRAEGSVAAEQIKPKLLSAVAVSHKLDEGLLKNWVIQILQSVGEGGGEDEGHPLYIWSKMVAGPQNAGAALRVKINQQQQARRDFQKQAVSLMPGERGIGSHQWTRTGEAFDDHVTSSISWTGAVPEQGLLSPAGIFKNGEVGQNLEGVLRSPTFELTHERIHLRLNGRKVKVRLVIDGFYMNNVHQLLFAGTVLKPENIDTGGQFQWFTMKGDLNKYVGHQVYLEISDLGDGFVSLAEVFMSEGDPPKTDYCLEGQLLKEGGLSDLPSLARAYGKLWSESLRQLGEGNPGAAELELINFIWSNHLWPGNIQAADELKQALGELQKLDAKTPKPLYATVMLEGTPQNDRVHIRGSHKRLGEVVERRNLSVFDGTPFSADSSGRLQLAAQLTSPDNPLVSRVVVNRLWHQIFGRGLVPTVDDFGDMGQRPSHPELLDWLATDFVAKGWSVKKMLRKMVLSKTYRMSSVANPGNSPERLAEIDPQNVLLHRATIRRLQGEAIRDAMLVVSGTLNQKIGGKSIRVHLTGFMEGRGRPKKSGPLDGGNRRSLYTEIRRNFLPPFMLTFDMPAPFNTMGRRSVSNVPAQALAMMNDSFVIEEAGRWAEGVRRDGAMTEAQKIDRMFLQAFGRLPKKKEADQARAFLKLESGDPARAWKDLCHVLFNKKEFIYLN